MRTPPIRARRNKTARELAKKYNVSTRTILNHVAEERKVYEQRAKDRLETAGKMYEEGKSWAEIAQAVEGTEWSARSLVRRYRLKNPTEA